MAGSALFKVPERAGRTVDTTIAKKANTKSTKSSVTVKGGGGLVERINAARAIVEKKFGHCKDLFLLIQDEEHLTNYISRAIDNGIISIDTETTGLDPLQDEIVGISIYTPGEKAAYIPIHHKSYVTLLEVNNQLSVDFIKSEFQRIVDNKLDVVMFNACFDIRVIRDRIDVKLTCTWDCYLGARLLNENEGAGNNGLKQLHKKYCTDGKDAAFNFGDIFEGISFDLVPINLGYLYAANDAIVTFELYEFQKPYLTIEDSVCIEHGLKDVAWVFHNIEMPCVSVVADMEDTGVGFDMSYNAELKEKYHKILDERLDDFNKACNMYSNEIDEYRRKAGISCKLEDPVNINSVPQLAILLYDIVGCKLYYDKKQKKETRSTSDDALSKLDNPIANAIRGYREFSVLVSTFIDKLPDCVNKKDGRIHCKFNQYGADTGRFSSNDPNLQNIPSHNKDIRKMFKATDGESYIDEVDNSFTIDIWCQVDTPNGFIPARDISVGDKLRVSESGVECEIIVSKIDKPVDKNQIVCYYN